MVREWPFDGVLVERLIKDAIRSYEEEDADAAEDFLLGGRTVDDDGM